jgi:hypothetical protein
LAEQATTAGSGPSPAALAFFDGVQTAYHQAAAKAGASEHTYRLGAHSFRLAFAGAALVPEVAPALEHLRVPAGEVADLTIHLWDIASTETPLPRRPWEWRDNPARSDVHSLSDERLLVAYNQFGRMLSVLDRQRGVAFWATADVAESGSYLSATPLLDILHWWLQPRGLQTVHGGALGIETGGVLLAGKGGSGKSTTSLACLSSELGFAGDDYCVVGTPGAPEVYSLYNSARIEVDNLGRLPHLRPLVSNRACLRGNGDKATFFLQQTHPQKIIRRFPLRAVLLPRVTGEPHSRALPASRMRAFRELAVSTINQRAGAGKGTFDGIASLVRETPCYELALGTDLRQLANLLEDLVIGARL